jgi:hypothetical protein
MSKPRKPPTKLKAYYSLAEYAALIGENVHTVRSQAKVGTVRAGWHGKKRVIYLSYLAAEKPELWASMVLLAQINNVSRK